MARITTQERKKLPSSKFALPGKGTGPQGKGPGSYPIDTPGRARNALSRVSQFGSSAERSKVRAAVRKDYPSIKQGSKQGSKQGGNVNNKGGKK